jgi:LmbE family N-acetylglucosaminyl deacetylase
MNSPDWSGTSVVAVEAHQDDVELAVMGTLIKMAAAGASITICSVTNGEKGASHLPDLDYAEVARIRCEEATASAARIGARFVCLGAEDEYLYDTPELRTKLVDVLREARADIVLCPPPTDYQDDHVRAGQMAAQAAHLACLPQLHTAFPALSRPPATYYYDSVAGLDFQPDFWVDISEVIENKCAGARLHASQMASQGGITGWDLVENIDALGRLRGLQTGVRYAEAFQLCRKNSRLRAWQVFPR